MSKPDPSISGRVNLPDGTAVRWDAASSDSQMRLQDVQFSTESGKGCSGASVTLTRPPDKEYADLKLLNELQLYTPQGKCVYEGRAQGVPSAENWTFDADGWWTHGEQRKFVDLIVDRDMGAWGESRLDRRLILAALGCPMDKDYSVTNESGGIVFTGQAGTSIVTGSSTDRMYVTPTGTLASQIMYQGTEANVGNVQAAALSSDDNPAVSSPATVSLTLDDTLRSATITDPAPYLMLNVLATGTHTPGATAALNRTYTQLAVYGGTGITTIARTDEPDGFAASDGIRYLAGKYAPKWDLTGVESTSYPIPQGVWRSPVTTCDAIQEMNAYHLWKLGVWPGRKLVFAPYDFTVADWQVKDGVNGVTVNAQGDTTENVFNGCAVNYTDFAGVQQRVTPTESTDLSDTSDWIAANQWGDTAWMEIDISWPVVQADAVQIGAIALAEANRARRPATITVPYHIQDMQGAWHPCSEVWADQTISVMNHFSPTPRKITSTSWSNHQLTITTDNAIDTLSAFNTRMTGALSAAGLT